MDEGSGEEERQTEKESVAWVVQVSHAGVQEAAGSQQWHGSTATVSTTHAGTGKNAARAVHPAFFLSQRKTKTKQKPKS